MLTFKITVAYSMLTFKITIALLIRIINFTTLFVSLTIEIAVEK